MSTLSLMPFDLLPRELIDCIIDLFQSNNPALKTCSLTCKSWVSRSSRYLFRRVNAHERAGDFLCVALASPLRITENLSELSLRLFTRRDASLDELTTVRDIVVLLPSLESLTLCADRVPTKGSLVKFEMAGQRLRHLRMELLPVHIVDAILHLFSSVEHLDLRPIDDGNHGELDAPRETLHRVERLSVEWQRTGAMAAFGLSKILDPAELSSLSVKDLEKDVLPDVARVVLIDELLQTAGRNIEHLEFIHCSDTGEFAGFVEPSLASLSSCSRVHSVSLAVAAKPSIPTSLIDIQWLHSLSLLWSLPEQTRHVQLVTIGKGLAEPILLEFMRGLDWTLLERALAHCKDLEGVEIAVVGHKAFSLFSLADNAAVKDIVLRRLGPDFARLVLFV